MEKFFDTFCTRRTAERERCRNRVIGTSDADERDGAFAAAIVHGTDRCRRDLFPYNFNELKCFVYVELNYGLGEAARTKRQRPTAAESVIENVSLMRNKLMKTIAARANSFARSPPSCPVPINLGANFFRAESTSRRRRVN